MLVYHTGGPVQDVVDMLHTGAGLLLQLQHDTEQTLNACLPYRWTCTRRG